jgi:hypothetical protein
MMGSSGLFTQNEKNSRLGSLGIKNYRPKPAVKE